MFTWNRPLVLAVLVALAAAMAAFSVYAETEYGLGRAATDSEIQAWNIDVRPDFQGLPKGQGTVDQGEEFWESTCAVCHGSFAESNAFFTPLIGGTTLEDIETGQVASLTSPVQSSRTIIMTTPTVSTLWDYIYRAMPWDNPRSLEPDDVYAALAYLLSLADIVDWDFTLSHENIADVQQRMPNRNGVIFWEGLWRVDGEPDTHNTACMQDCIDTIEVSSELPDHARDAHGDLALQNRIVGPVRGVNTLAPALTEAVDTNTQAVRSYARAQFDRFIEESQDVGTEIQRLLQDNGCLICHATAARKVGPSFLEVAEKYAADEAALGMLADKIQQGGSGVWGSMMMPPNPNLSDADTRAIVDWISAGAPE